MKPWKNQGYRNLGSQVSGEACKHNTYGLQEQPIEFNCANLNLGTCGLDLNWPVFGNLCRTTVPWRLGVTFVLRFGVSVVCRV